MSSARKPLIPKDDNGCGCSCWGLFGSKSERPALKDKELSRWDRFVEYWSPTPRTMGDRNPEIRKAYNEQTQDQQVDQFVRKRKLEESRKALAREQGAEQHRLNDLHNGGPIILPDSEEFFAQRQQGPGQRRF